MNFQESVKMSMRIHNDREPVELTETYARFPYEDRFITFQRLIELEKTISNTYEHLDFIAYESNQYAEVDDEIELIIKEKGERFILFVRTADIAEFQSMETRLYRLYEEKGKMQVVDTDDLTLYETYPRVEEMVFDYVQQLPKYRLYFATGTITIEKWDEYE